MKDRYRKAATSVTAVQLELFAGVQEHKEYELQDLFQHLNRKHWNGKLPSYRCEWSDRMISTWGSCYPHKQLIRINSLFKQRPHSELVALLCHEMIHIRYRGHGVKFRKELKRIGLFGDIQRHFPHLNAITDALRRPLKHTYECPACHIQVRRRRRIKGYCAACYAAGSKSKFRLI